MKDPEICQASWCREPWAFRVYTLAPAWATRLCADHAERYAKNPAFIVEPREKAESK